MDDDMLGKGVAAGIITAEQADRLRALRPVVAYEDTLTGPPLSPDDEQLRLVTSFSDIFVTIGIGLFLGAVGWFAVSIAGPFGLCVVLAIASWLLAEFFTRQRRMALPSIVLLLVYAISIFFAVVVIFELVDTSTPSTSRNWFLPNIKSAPLILAGLVTALLTAFHYWRFRVPITIAAGCAALAITMIGLVTSIAPNTTATYLSIILFVCGVAIFALAMRFDMSDRERLTRRADIAFWLHLLAAPLIVHSLVSGYIGSRIDASTAATIIIIFLLLSLVAVLIDRRAMLVSGLSYAGYAFGSLIRGAGLADMTVPITLLVLGAFILLLSAGWRATRGFLLDGLPGALTRHLPPRTVRS